MSGYSSLKSSETAKLAPRRLAGEAICQNDSPMGACPVLLACGVLMPGSPQIRPGGPKLGLVGSRSGLAAWAKMFSYFPVLSFDVEKEKARQKVRQIAPQAGRPGRAPTIADVLATRHR